MLKTKVIGFMFYHDKWPPKPSEIDHDIAKVSKKLGFLPKTCLLHAEMPEIVLGTHKIEVIRVKRGCPKKCLWIGLNMNDYGDHVLGLGEYATERSDST